MERGTFDRLSISLDRIDRVDFCLSETVASIGVEPWVLPTLRPWNHQLLRFANRFACIKPMMVGYNSNSCFASPT
jgi:hypothetical protein